MKKLDILSIIIVLLISASTFGIYFSKHKIDDNNLVVELEYNNSVICELDVSNDKRYNVTLSGSTTEGKIAITVMDTNYNIISTKVISTQVKKTLDYSIYVSAKDTHIKSALCEHGYCMKMRLDNVLKTPIICVDGLVINYQSGLNITIVTGDN